MKPIINPWLIYLINLFDNLKGLLTVALFLLGCVAVVLSVIWFFGSMLWIMNRIMNLLLHVKRI